MVTPERLSRWQAALFPTGYSGMRLIRVGEWWGFAVTEIIGYGFTVGEAYCSSHSSIKRSMYSRLMALE